MNNCRTVNQNFRQFSHCFSSALALYLDLFSPSPFNILLFFALVIFCNVSPLFLSHISLFHLSLCPPSSSAENSRAVPWQQNDPHPAGLPRWKLPHHHVHLLLSLQLQRCRDQVDFDVWTTVKTSVDTVNASVGRSYSIQYTVYVTEVNSFKKCHVSH